MSETLVTRCPNCSTSFNVLEEHLKMAHGKVRCGSCMYVFSAMEFMVQDNVPTLKAAPINTNADQSIKPAQRKEDIVTQATPNPDPSTDVVFDEDDEAFTQEVEIDISTPSTNNDTKTKKEPFFNSEDLENLEHEEVCYAEVSAFTKDHSKIIADEHTRTQILNSLNTEPPEFRRSRIVSRIYYLLRWSILIAIAIAGLAAQFAWFNKDSLAQDPTLRPFLEQLCKQAQCNLPPAIDLTNIRNDHHVLRDHPTTKNKILVNAIISNHAVFEQPFPTIQIIFKDTSNRSIANYYIQPSQYLKGEMAGKSSMPLKSPVHIAFELPNPGNIATGHEIYFRPFDFKP